MFILRHRFIPFVSFRKIQYARCKETARLCLRYPASRVSFDLPRQIGKRICLGRSKETPLAGYMPSLLDNDETIKFDKRAIKEIVSGRPGVSKTQTSKT